MGLRCSLIGDGLKNTAQFSWASSYFPGICYSNLRTSGFQVIQPVTSSTTLLALQGLPGQSYLQAKKKKKKKKNTHIDSGQGDSDWTRCPAHNKQGNMRTITGGRPESWIQIPNSPPFVMGSWESCLTSFRRISPPEKWYLYYLTPRIAPTGKYDNTGTTLKYILLHTVSTP